MNPLAKPVDTRVNFAAVLLDAIAEAREESRPIVFVGEPGSGATLLAQRIGGLFCPLRAPHHTAGERALAGELALAAGGTLFFDEAHEVSTFDLRNTIATWQMMEANPAQPLLILSVPDSEGVDRLRKAFGDNNMIVINL